MTAEVKNSSTVLLVDDDVIGRHLLSEYLRHCGYMVIEAATADEALVVLQSKDVLVHVVLSGVEMRGDAGGFDLAKWVRTNRQNIDVILAATLNRAADVAGDLCEEGPLSKPYEPQVVVDRIKRLRAARSAKTKDKTE